MILASCLASVGLFTSEDRHCMRGETGVIKLMIHQMNRDVLGISVVHRFCLWDILFNATAPANSAVLSSENCHAAVFMFPYDK